MAERLGNRAINQKVAGLIPGQANGIVSLGKALHPTCLGGEERVLLTDISLFQYWRFVYTNGPLDLVLIIECGHRLLTASCLSDRRLISVACYQGHRPVVADPLTS